MLMSILCAVLLVDRVKKKITLLNVVFRWATSSSWSQQDGCPRQAMLRVVPSQCLGAMPGFHVPDGLEFSRQNENPGTATSAISLSYRVHWWSMGHMTHVDAEVKWCPKGAREVQL